MINDENVRLIAADKTNFLARGGYFNEIILLKIGKVKG